MAANSHRGEVDIDIGDGVERKLRFTFNAMAEIEEHFGGDRPIQEILTAESLKRAKASDWRAIIAAGLRAGGDEEMTDERLGSIMGFGEMMEATAKINEAFSLANTGSKKGDGKKDQARSTKPKASSTSNE